MLEVKSKEDYDQCLRIVREAKERFGGELLNHPDIHALGIGYKTRKGKRTKEMCLVAHVIKKLPARELKKGRLINPKFSFFSRVANEEVTVSVDIFEAGFPVLKGGECDQVLNNARSRPVKGGYSIVGVPPGPGPGGTLGGWAWDTTEERPVLISCQHTIGTGGEIVLQPANGNFQDEIAEVIVAAQRLDAAIAAPYDNIRTSYSIECIGPAIYEILDPVLNMEVEKVGAASGLTSGVIVQIDLNIGAFPGVVDPLVNNFLVINEDNIDIVLDGDSGSLFVEKNNPNPNATWKRVVGLCFAGNGEDTIGICHYISHVFNELDLTIICAGFLPNFFDLLIGNQ